MADALTELKALEKKRGRLIPGEVVDVARDPMSDLHDYFEWNDGEAAESWRLLQATKLIRRFRIEVELTPERHIRPRQFSLAPNRKGELGYIDTEEAMKREDSREFILAQALRELEMVRRKYQGLIEWADVLAADLAKAS